MNEFNQITLADYRVENESVAYLNEKIMQHDFKSLVDAECLALTVGINIDKAKTVISKYGLHNLLSVAEVIDLNNVQHAKLHSLYELFKLIVSGGIDDDGDLIKSPEAAFKLFTDLQFRTNETIKVALLNTANKLISIEVLSEGSLDRTHIYTRELIRLCIKTSTKGIILAHNHPSNSLTFSENDIRTTERIKKALALVEINLLDHLVIVNGGFASMKNKGMIRMI